MLFTLEIVGTSRTGVLRAVIDRVADLRSSVSSISEVCVYYYPPMFFNG